VDLVVPSAIKYVPNEIAPNDVGVADWEASPFVEQVDFTAEGAPEAIKARKVGVGSGYAKPLVVVNVMGGLKKLSELGDVKRLEEILRAETKGIQRAMRKQPQVSLEETSWAQKRVTCAHVCIRIVGLCAAYVVLTARGGHRAAS
jgi:hypothetical protein